jgi:MSHA pilin protein MshD
MCTRHKQRGISLIELIMFIVIVSVALAGILLVMNVTTRGSADPLIHKQALAAAESLLEEIELQDFTAATGAISPNPVTQANRATGYHIVSDYNGFTTTGIFTLDNNPVAGLGNYNVSPPVEVVLIAAGELGALIPAASAVRITVHVTDPTGQSIDVTGYRTAY